MNISLWTDVFTATSRTCGRAARPKQIKAVNGIEHYRGCKSSPGRDAQRRARHPHPGSLTAVQATLLRGEGQSLWDQLVDRLWSETHRDNNK